MLDLYKLQIFLVVAQEGSFSAAADGLYLTQSAISQHIKDLEISLGRTLFERGWRGVKLTAHGEVLYGYARQIFALVAQAEAALTDVAQLSQGRILIGATPGVGVYLLPGWVRAFRDRFPRLTVELTTGVTADIVKLVLSRQADVGFVEGELDVHQHPRLASAALQAIEQKVVVGRQHALWDTPALRIDDLRGQSFVVRTQNSQSRLWLEEKLREAGITPIIGAAFDNMEAIKRALAAGSCLSILPPYVVEDEVRRGELRTLSVQDLPLHRTLKVIWDQAAHLSPVARAFLREISPNYPPLHDLLAASS